MDTIVSFLKKFSNIKPTARVVKEAVFDTLKEKKIPVAIDEIVYSNSIVYIKSNQVVKNEIFISKKEILKNIEDRLNRKIVTDIR